MLTIELVISLIWSVVASFRQTVWILKVKQRTKTIIGQCFMSDNATTFVASSKFVKDIQENNNKVQKGLSQLNYEWK